MKKLVLILLGAFLIFVAAPCTYATTSFSVQDDKATVQTDQTSSDHSAENTGSKVINAVVALLLLGAFFGGLAYMFIILRKKYYTETSVEQMIEQRRVQGLSEKASDEENEKAFELLETALVQWSSYKGEDGETYYIPRRMAQVKRSVALINQAKQFMPTSETVINRMNELGGIVKERTARSFAGSWSLLTVSGLVLLLFFFIGPSGGFFKKLLSLWWLWGSMIFYIMASYAPQFLIEKRMEWFGGKKFSSGLIKTVLAIVAATPVTYTVVTKWSDGSTTKSEEGASEYLFIVALALIALIIIGVCIIFFGIINFIRNYILFF